MGNSASIPQQNDHRRIPTNIGRLLVEQLSLLSGIFGHNQGRSANVSLNDTEAPHQRPQSPPQTRPRYNLRRTLARIRRRGTPEALSMSAVSTTQTVLEDSRTLPTPSINTTPEPPHLPPRPATLEPAHLNSTQRMFHVNSTNSLGESGINARRRLGGSRPESDDVVIDGGTRRPRLEYRDIIGQFPGGLEADEERSFYFIFPFIPQPTNAEESPSQPRPSSPATADMASNEGSSNPQTSRHPEGSIVFVRVRQAAEPPLGSNTPRDPVSILQWTLYFLLPPHGDSLDPSNLPIDPQAVLAQAFAAFNTMLSDNSFSYEELSRLQEMIGFVNRGVTKEQIDTKLMAFPFKSAEACGSGSSCSICLLDYVIDEPMRKLPCSHTYHAECIDKWLVQVNKCPLCRQEPIEKEPVSQPPP